MGRVAKHTFRATETAALFERVALCLKDSNLLSSSPLHRSVQNCTASTKSWISTDILREVCKAAELACNTKSDTRQPPCQSESMWAEPPWPVNSTPSSTSLALPVCLDVPQFGNLKLPLPHGHFLRSDDFLAQHSSCSFVSFSTEGSNVDTSKITSSFYGADTLSC